MPLAAIATLAGCYSSHGRDLDARDPRRFDAGSTDADVLPEDVHPPLETDTPITPDPCLTSIGLRRCHGTSEGVCGWCPTGYNCVSEIGVCIPGWGAYACEFRRDAVPREIAASPGCPSGACFYVGDELPAAGTRARCVPEEVCLLSDAEIGPHRCFWSDGTEVTRIPPVDPCPDFEPDALECGRSCAGTSCEATGLGCLGVSDERGVGVCADLHLPFYVCSGEPGNVFDELLCSLNLPGLPCSCMRPVVAAASTIERFGFMVPGAVCPRYAALYPGQFECITIPIR